MKLLVVGLEQTNQNSISGSISLFLPLSGRVPNFPGDLSQSGVNRCS